MRSGATKSAVTQLPARALQREAGKMRPSFSSPVCAGDERKLSGWLARAAPVAPAAAPWRAARGIGWRSRRWRRRCCRELRGAGSGRAMFRSPAFAGTDVAKGRTIRRRRLEVVFFSRLRFSLRILPIFALTAVTRARVNAQGIGAGIFALSLAGGGIGDVEQVSKVAGVFLFVVQDFFHHHAGGRVIAAEVTDHVLIDLNDHTLGDEVFADHLGQALALNVLRGGALEQRTRIEIGLAAELLNALGDAIGVLAFAVGMLLEFTGHALAVHAGGHEVMVHVAQHADNLGGQGFVENRDGLLHIAFVAGGDRAVF